MSKSLPFTAALLPALSALVPSLHVQIATSTLLRGETAKGRYDIRLSDDGRELRTSFLAKGRNPLKQSKLLLRSPLSDEGSVQGHAIVIRENEMRLPWIQRAQDSRLGDDIVTVRPFGSDETAPYVAVRTSALTGFISLTVENAREMSPAEAKFVAKALAKAAKLAAVSKIEPVALSAAA
ncbi:MAG TPA: hypothetical protein VIS74_05675 [Chthoniobacterales bacterium]